MHPTETNLSDYLKSLQQKGIYSFTRSELAEKLSISSGAVSQALYRQVRKGRVLRIRGDFYVIIPVEHAARGVIPIDWFLDALMRRMGSPYYIGLLSAAAFHGAAHQQPQETQIVIPGQEPPIRNDRLRIRFFTHKEFHQIPLTHIKGYAGTLPVSTPEATALDLVKYASRLGGMDAVGPVLVELAEVIRPAEWAQAANAAPTSCVQRLGWIFDHLELREQADALHTLLMENDPPSRVLLDPGGPATGSSKHNRWRVIENTVPEMVA